MGFVFAILSAAVGLWVSYWVLKSAIRDGIKEAGKSDRNWFEPNKRTGGDTAPHGMRWVLEPIPTEAGAVNTFSAKS